MPDYRHAAEPDRPRVVDPRALSASTRRRLALAVAEAATLSATGDREPGKTRGWAKLMTLGATLLALLVYAGFGSLPARPGSGPPLSTALWAAGLWALLAGGTMLLRKLVSLLRSPVRPGVYLLPGELIDARDGHLVVVPVSLLREVRHAPGVVTLDFAHAGPFAFPLDDARARGLSRRLDEAKARLDRAHALDDRDELDRVDPLRDDRAIVEASPLASPPPPPRRRRAQLVALGLISLSLAAPLEHGRDLDSQRFGIASAARAHDRRRLLRYAQAGGELAALADRAALDTALADGSTHALRNYIELGGRLRDEADEALFTAAAESGEAEPLAEYVWAGRRHTDLAWRLIFARDARYSPLHVDHGNRLRDLAEREPAAREAAQRELRERQSRALDRVSSRKGQGPRLAALVLEAARDRGESLWLSLDDQLPPGFGNASPETREKSPFDDRWLSLALSERLTIEIREKGPFSGSLVPTRYSFGRAPAEPTLTVTIKPVPFLEPKGGPAVCEPLANINLLLTAELAAPSGESTAVTVRADQRTWRPLGCVEPWVARNKAIDLLASAIIAELEGQ